MKTSVRIEGADKLLKALRDLPKEFAGKGGNAVRAGVRAAAKVVQAELLTNLDQVIAEPNIGGVDESTGLLRESVRVTKRKVPNGESQIVRVSNRKYPSGATTAQVARLLEYGTENMTAKPFIRPAHEAKKEEAARLMVEDAQRRIDKVWKGVR